MKDIIVIVKNSLIAKTFNFIDKENIYFYKEFKKINFKKYNKLKAFANKLFFPITIISFI